MNTSAEQKTCQNCKGEFTVEPDDFAFYEKMQVPAPTFCPACRFQRRTMFRNERVLYRRACDLCGKNMITVYSPEKPLKVYCNPCWWSDKWESTDYAKDYDSTRPFLEQFNELQRGVPRPALILDYPTLENSEYVNHAGHLKNCYLVFDIDYSENTLFSTALTNVKDSADCNFVLESELCYGSINCSQCYQTIFSEDCTSCHGVYFSKNLSGCNNCFGCINLRNKEYFIFNEQHSKEEYDKKLKEFTLGSWASILKHKQAAYELWLKHPHKYFFGKNNVDVSGDYIQESKNVHHSFQMRGAEDGKYCCRVYLKPASDVYDYFEWGNGAQRIYECITVGERAENVKFSFFSGLSAHDVEYSMIVVGSSDMFGCAGMRNKKYCILNKQYSPEEYQKLRAKIIQDMAAQPYTDTQGRVFTYGEFLPYDLSSFGYNESTAMQYFPLTKEEVLAKGWQWRDPTPSEHKITKQAGELTDSIADTNDEILKEVIACAECGSAYRIIPPELELLRRLGLPLPRKCPECRHKERFARLTPPQLWERKCANCGKAIETAYAPDRPEIVYCEECYQKVLV